MTANIDISEKLICSQIHRAPDSNCAFYYCIQMHISTWKSDKFLNLPSLKIYAGEFLKSGKF